MSHTQAQAPQTIRYGSGILRVGGQNVGLLEGAKADLQWSVIQVKAHNGRLPAKKKIQEVKFEASLYEINLEVLAMLDGHGILSTLTGGAGTVTAEVKEVNGTWAVGEIYWLDKKLVTSITNVKNGATTINSTDYKLVQDANGRFGIVNISASPVIITGIGINVTYAYTIVTAKVTTFSDVAKLVEYNDIEFVNVDENGKEFKIKIPKGYNTANMTFEFVSDDATDQVMTMPISFTSVPDEDNVMLVITDEQGV